MSNYSKEFLELFDSLTESELLGEELKHEVSKMIRRCRNEKNMSQKEFADYLNVNQSMVSKWESHEYNFSLEAIGAIFTKLGKKITISTDDSYDQYSKFAIKYKNGITLHEQSLAMGA